MTDDEQDHDKNFLSRWSQRKHEAKLQDTGTAAAKPPEEVEALSAPTAEAAEEPFDLSTLPRLEDITEATNLTIFLRKGVPESLRNAALRKAWALDPAIRNYVNPALDYAYDWNTPGGVPGSGELAPGTDIAKMVRQIMGHDPETSTPQTADASPNRDAAEFASSSSSTDAPQDTRADPPVQQLRLSDSQANPTAALVEDEQQKQVQVESAQPVAFAEFDAPQKKVRRHGTAKPRI